MPRLRELATVACTTADLVRTDIDERVDLLALPHRDGTFGGVYCSHVLQDVRDDFRAMVEVFRVLAHGGWAILNVPVMAEYTVEHVDAPAGARFLRPGRKLILLGGLLPGADDRLDRRFGSSAYAKTVLGQTWGLPPALDLDYETAVQAVVREAVRGGLVESAHDLSDGGLAVALAECCFGPAKTGARLAIETDLPAHLALFHEAPSRVLVSVSAETADAVLRLAASRSVSAPVIGETIADEIAVEINGCEAFRAPVAELHALWDTALESMLEVS